ncbi:MAG: hypothetical protein NWF10_07835 [Candidatus Bathyarchaeota archaeon]|nr:hypothetical protein [Candidatus Bathyarchaeota archaeon]
MLLVTMVFANTFLDTRLAENEFNANKQFLLTTGLQIDDIAWTIGRTQTIRYSSRFGTMAFQSAALNYTFEVRIGSAWKTLFSNITGMIMFNMPVEAFSMGNNYFDRISPTSNGSFLQQGSTAPVNHVFGVTNLPMAEGNYTRLVVAPTIRVLNSTIAGPQQGATRYYKFYLPVLEPGTHLYRSQSITMTGSDITKIAESGVNQVKITLTFPNGDESLGFGSNFFKFDHSTEIVNLPGNSVVEFYVGSVIVTLGKV